MVIEVLNTFTIIHESIIVIWQDKWVSTNTQHTDISHVDHAI